MTGASISTATIRARIMESARACRESDERHHGVTAEGWRTLADFRMVAGRGRYVETTRVARALEDLVRVGELEVDALRGWRSR